MRTVSVIDFEGASTATAAASTAEITGGTAIESPEAIDEGGNVGTELGGVPRIT